LKREKYWMIRIFEKYLVKWDAIKKHIIIERK